MRLFVALDIDPQIRQRLGDFRNQMRAYAPDARWVGPETFHVTLQFIGETEKLAEIRNALQQVQAAAVSVDLSRDRLLSESKIAARLLGRHRVGRALAATGNEDRRSFAALGIQAGSCSL